MPQDIESIERATLDAVAPRLVLPHGDWLVPIDQTTIGRAISAVPLHHGARPETDLFEIERLFFAHHQKARFRIADVPPLDSFQRLLALHGYHTYQPTLTQTVDLHHLLQRTKTIPGFSVHISRLPTDSWQSVYLSNDFDPVDGAQRVAALSRSSCTTYAWVLSEQIAVAAGTLSMSHQWLGFHGMRTLSEVRGKGIAGLLLAAMAEFGVREGYSKGYLQVDEENMAATKLYRKLGFQTQWRYHYWLK